MIPLLTVAASLVTPPADLGVMSAAHARSLDGHQVRLSFYSERPSDYHNGRTVLGCPDRPDGVERTVILKGELIRAEGRWLRVAGTLRVYDHPARVVGAAFVPAWVEIRVEE